jgi:hypothetical protein
MPASQRDDVSWPFLALAVVLASVVAAGYLSYPDLFAVDDELALAYGGLLVVFALVYGYRPLRESRVGALVSATFLMLFAVMHYRQGFRGPLMPFGLFVLALAGFCYELYKLTSSRVRRGQAS